MLSMNKKDEKIVEYLCHHKNILWTTIVVLSGGLVGLVLTYNPLAPFAFGNIARCVFIVIGCVFLYGMFLGVINTDFDIRKYLGKG